MCAPHATDHALSARLNATAEFEIEIANSISVRDAAQSALSVQHGGGKSVIDETKM